MPRILLLSSHLTAAAAAHMTKQQLPHTCSTPAEGVTLEAPLPALGWDGGGRGSIHEITVMISLPVDISGF